MMKLAEENKDKIIVWISHGYCTELIRERLSDPDPFKYYNYGSVNRYILDSETNQWKIVDIDAKYH
jgi:hypothetical protein